MTAGFEGACASTGTTKGAGFAGSAFTAALVTFEEGDATGAGATGVAGFDVETFGVGMALAEAFSTGADACFTVGAGFTDSDFTTAFGTFEDAGGTDDGAGGAAGFGVEMPELGAVLTEFFSTGAAEAVGIKELFIPGSAVRTGLAGIGSGFVF
jgi:hypothetical protein